MNNASVLHFRDEFGQTTEKSSAVASVAGWVAPLGKIVGGYLSDRAYQKWSLKGRLWLHFGACAMTGGVLMVFANTRSLNGLIVLLAVTSLVGNIASSTSYSIVPYIYPLRTGSVAGIVATGDLIGEIGFSVGFMNLKYYSALSMMGVVILGTLNWLLNEGIVACVNQCYAHTFDTTSWIRLVGISLLTILIRIEGYSGLFCITSKNQKQGDVDKATDHWTQRAEGNRCIQTDNETSRMEVDGTSVTLDIDAV